MNTHNDYVTLLALSNLWNVLIWKFLFVGTFDLGKPCWHSSDIVMSPCIFSKKDHCDLLPMILVNAVNNSASQVMYVGYFNCSAQNQHSRMETFVPNSGQFLWMIISPVMVKFDFGNLWKTILGLWNIDDHVMIFRLSTVCAGKDWKL